MITGHIDLQTIFARNLRKAGSKQKFNPQSAHEQENNDKNVVSQIFDTNSQYFSVPPQIFLLPQDKRQDAQI